MTDPTHPSGGAILGLDNVQLDLPLAGLGSRSLAALIDHIFLFVLQIVWVVGGMSLTARLGASAAWWFAILLFGIFLVQWGYFSIFEIAMQGRTPGKLVMKLQTVSAHGGRASVAALLIRNLIRTLDLLVGIPMMAIDHQRRRLGDLVAATLVVHLDPGAEEIELGNYPESWGGREIAVVENFLRRADGLETSKAEAMAQQLWEWMVRREPEFVATLDASIPHLDDPVLRLQRALGLDV